ncbi:MAG: MJ1477/TM1410 family putative glycoside hydrolase [Promethearchaeota archaeon]
MHKKILILTLIVIIIGASIGLYFLIQNIIYLRRIEFELGDMVIDDFAYWLDEPNKDEIRESKYDLIIIDYSSDGSEDGEFSSRNVKYMKSSGDKEKLLISYISIGEAEDYRFYWDESWDIDKDGIPDTGSPNWLDEENPEWDGNYKVKFWIDSWKEIIFDYLDKIISAKFDGIYMDLIDAYEYYKDDVPDSDELMVDFVGEISDYVKDEQGENFIVFVQNGEDLLKDSTYLDYIDGIGREDLFYNDDDETDEEDREDGVNNLNKVLENNKAVLIIDYPTSEEKKYNFYKLCINNGFLPYAAERDLNGLLEYWYYPST